MAGTPAPDLWDEAVAAAVNADRDILGLDLLDAEFGWRGFPDLSPDFLRRKALRQLRDRFGRWRQERGNLLGVPARPRASTDIDPLNAPRVSPGLVPGSKSPDSGSTPPEHSGPGSKSLDLSPGTGDVQRIPAEIAERILVERGGFPRARAKKWAARGAVYEYGNQGDNPIFAFVVHQQEAMKVRLEGAQYNVNQAQRHLDVKRRQWERMLDRGVTGGPALEKLTDRVEVLEQRLADRTAVLEDQRRKWSRAMGYDDIGAEAMTSMVEEAAALLDAQVAKMPQWKRSSTKGFMAEFDESVLLGDEIDLVSAQAVRGGSIITLNRNAFRQSTDTLPDNWEMATGARTFGQYAIPHESGHLVDEARLNAPWSSMMSRQVWDQAIASGLMSRYGMGNPREGYAEAYAMWQHDPTSPVARMYDEHFRWSAPARPGSPHPSDRPEEAWDALMQEGPPPDESPEPFEPSRSVQRFEGHGAVRAMTQAGFSAGQAIEYARQGEVFTRDGKVWSFHPHPTTAPLPHGLSARAALQRNLDLVRTNPRTGQPYQRLPVARKDEARALERMIRGLDLQIRTTSPGRPEALSSKDVAAARTLLREMERGVKKLPRWRRDEGGPFMVEADPDLTARKGERVAGVAVSGSNTITLNRDWLDPSWVASRFFPADSVGQTVRHELGHVTDSRQGHPASSRSTGGMAVWEVAKTLRGMTTYGLTSTAEGYAEMFQLWMEGKRDLPAVQIYARAFGWTAAQRKEPTVRGARAHGRKLTAEGGSVRTLGPPSTGSSWSRRSD